MNNDDIQIELGQSVRRHIEGKTSPLKDRALATAPYDSPQSDKIPVFISLTTMRAIEKHIGANKEREVGGVLLGGFYRSDEGSFVEVTDIVEAQAQGTDVSLTFTHDTWEQIIADQARRNPDLQIVGWYHSHPGLGVFMSREDQFIHTSYFADPWHGAVVVDPIYHNWGCFKWNDGELERTGGFHVFAAKKDAKGVRDYAKTLSSVRQSPAMDASAAADRPVRAAGKSGALWLAIVVLLLLQLATGYYALTRKGAEAPETDHYKTAISLLSACDLSGGAQELRAELLAHPDNAAAYRELARVNTLASGELKNDDLDQANFLLAMADRMARTRIKLKEKSGFEDFASDAPANQVKLEAADPVKDALRVYQEAAPTRAARLQRALKIAAAAKGATRGSGAAWYDKAVKWLQGERLREVAYGLHAGVESYQPAYSRLSVEEKAAAKRIRAELIAAK